MFHRLKGNSIASTVSALSLMLRMEGFRSEKGHWNYMPRSTFLEQNTFLHLGWKQRKYKRKNGDWSVCPCFFCGRSSHVHSSGCYEENIYVKKSTVYVSYLKKGSRKFTCICLYITLSIICIALTFNKQWTWEKYTVGLPASEPKSPFTHQLPIYSPITNYCDLVHMWTRS